MTELIERGSVIERLEKVCVPTDEDVVFYMGMQTGIDHAIECLKEADVIDTPETVCHCAECKYYDGYDCDRLDLQLTDPDDYCSWGERRCEE